MLARNQTKHGTYTVSVLSIKTGEWESSNINCAQTQPADLTHILDLILLRRLLQKQALEKTSTSAYCNTYVRKKTDLLGVYNVCFLRFLCFLFSLCLQNRCRNQKSVHHMSSAESSTVLASFLADFSASESCLAGAFGRPCKFSMYDTCIQT